MAVFPNLNQKIRDAVTKLEEQLVRPLISLSMVLVGRTID